MGTVAGGGGEVGAGGVQGCPTASVVLQAPKDGGGHPLLLQLHLWRGGGGKGRGVSGTPKQGVSHTPHPPPQPWQPPPVRPPPLPPWGCHVSPPSMTPLSVPPQSPGDQRVCVPHPRPCPPLPCRRRPPPPTYRQARARPRPPGRSRRGSPAGTGRPEPPAGPRPCAPISTRTHGWGAPTGGGGGTQARWWGSGR